MTNTRTARDFLHACKIGDLASVKAAIAANIDLDGPKEWESPLSAAIVHNHTDIALLLIEAGADIDQKSFGGWTPFAEAVYRKNIPVVEALAAKGAKLDEVSDNGKTALTCLIRNFDETADYMMIKKVLSLGCKPDQKTIYGYTALMHAVHRKDLEIVNILLSFGADPHMKNDLGKTARTLAEESGATEILAAFDLHEEKRIQKIGQHFNCGLEKPMKVPKKIQMKKKKCPRPKHS